MRHNAYMTPLGTILLLACAPVFAQQYTIATIAGNGVAGVNFINPTSVAVDPAGDIYVADWSGYIRKVWVREGAATIVAGTGILGYGGDGGQATNARIGKAISLALDGAGNIYFADGDNNRIRRVDISTGIVTTVAGTGAAADSGDGGPAVSAGVSQPTGITVDAAGDLYFSSSWSRVRKVGCQHAGLSRRLPVSSPPVSAATTDRLSTLYSGIPCPQRWTGAVTSTLRTTRTPACGW